MLNIFPSLLTYSFSAPTLVRVGVAVSFLIIGYKTLFLTKDGIATVFEFEAIGLRPAAYFAWFFGTVELLAGVCLAAGFVTQIAAMATGLISLGFLCMPGKNRGDHLPINKLALFLLLVCSLSLIFSGAGAYAFDIPL